MKTGKLGNSPLRAHYHRSLILEEKTIFFSIMSVRLNYFLISTQYFQQKILTNNFGKKYFVFSLSIWYFSHSSDFDFLFQYFSCGTKIFI